MPRRIAALLIPHRFVAEDSILLRPFIDEVNHHAKTSGVVLCDSQLMGSEIPTAGWPEKVLIERHPTGFPKIIRLPNAELVLEPGTGESWPVQDWPAALEPILGFKNPVRLNDEPSGFCASHLTIDIDGHYLFADEQILGIVDGIEDRRDFDCGCHYADVVYTTRQRLMCMSCGRLHVVLAAPLKIEPLKRFTELEWYEYFDPDGQKRFRKVQLSTIDFRKFEHAELLWKTPAWEEACHKFILFARTPPDELREMLRGTEQDPSILEEAGFSPEQMPPSPADQIAEVGVELSLSQNAAHAARNGVASLILAKTEPEALVSATAELFRCVELLLKCRLESGGPLPKKPRLDTQRLLALIKKAGVTLSAAELTVLSDLRRLRNDIQHATPKFNYRAALETCHSALELIDRFSREELDLWLADVVPSKDWKIILESSTAIKSGAVHAARRRITNANLPAEAEIAQCDFCKEQTMVRDYRSSGQKCVLCRHVPVLPESTYDSLISDAPSE